MPDEGTASPAPSAIAELIEAADRGDREATGELFKRLYAELHRLAESQLRRMAHPNLTLGATTILHEFYLDVSQRERASFPDRSRFMAYAARAMRGLIIDYVRERRAEKRGGLYHLTALNTQIAKGTPKAADELERIGDCAGSARRSRARAGRDGRSEIFLWSQLRRDRGPARRVGANRAKRLEQGATVLARNDRRLSGSPRESPSLECLPTSEPRQLRKQQLPVSSSRFSAVDGGACAFSISRHSAR